MDGLGLLRIRVLRGINLAVRDTRTSDPYVVIDCASQVLFFLTTNQHLLISIPRLFPTKLIHLGFKSSLFTVMIILFLNFLPGSSITLI